MTAKELRERIRRGVERLEVEAQTVKDADSSSITEFVRAEGKIEICKALQMMLDTIPIEGCPDEDEEEPTWYKSPVEKRYYTVLRAAQQVVGIRLGEGRRKEDVLIRVFVSHRLRSEGYSFEAIGKVMHRDHSTVIHYVRSNMGDMLSLPNMYREELEKYKKMNEILDEQGEA